MAEKHAAHKKRQAERFVEKWHGRGYEKGEAQAFWMDLLTDVVGMEDVSTRCLFEQRTAAGGFIDANIPDSKTIVEQKSSGVDLDKKETRQGLLVTPYEQAKRYADTLPNTHRPDYIIVCNFHEFRIHDLNKVNPAEDYVSFVLDELPKQAYLLDFLIDPKLSRQARELEISWQAGQLIGELYDLLRKQYVDPDLLVNQHALNVLCVRLVFCLFAEDGGVFRSNAFSDYLAGVPANLWRRTLQDLFDALDTPENERDPYLEEGIARFPYVNGGLFRERTEIPQFTEEIKELLINKVARTDWSEISPTIFGGVFESTLNPETRASGGMHYTSPENIHRVIDPLFLDNLTAELDDILTRYKSQAALRRELRNFHDRLSKLTFFDPACGSGNFLTETYLSLRRLENKILSVLLADQGAFDFADLGEEASFLKIRLDQFVGIEINEFATNVANTALWIAQLQSNLEAETIIQRTVKDLPLRDSAHIIQGNALTTDWNRAVEASDCNYIIGNPPFLGARNQNADQKAEIKAVFNGAKNSGNIDYVAGWFAKASDYIQDFPIECAFVATNSICQGEQVANVWYPLYQKGVRIDFAHDTFRWANESNNQAHVFCVIVGFSKQGGMKYWDTEQRKFVRAKVLFHHDGPDGPVERQQLDNLNAYLVDAADGFVWNQSKPLSHVPPIGIGNKPIDGGNYLFTPEEKAEFLAKEPGAESYFHPWLGAKEFLQGKKREVLWLGDATPAELKKLPLCKERIKAVQQYRQDSKSAGTRKIADRPTRFHVENMPEGTSIVVPKTSSERRKLVPLGFVDSDTLCGDAVFLIPGAELWHFGVLHSRVHNAWMRTVAGRLKSDYRYSGGMVYNTFIWPNLTEAQKVEIGNAAQAVLDARKVYTDCTLADLYDPDDSYLYPALLKAHNALDVAVEKAYGFAPGIEEKDIVAALMERYLAATAQQQ
ncbi:DNA methyltransferase [Corynebacterium aquilae]|uniref:site-specific DNA-methyltransferase (adenine-specific) n=1 Tax=Corynebacterium aquilae DSM 44791 TaxID=1431546 RepID=A0A1L7CH95_9CORY|nr:DNA methyltransferase [Corynebacterium aquilae]APT85204.1 DNA methyltransferase [Corynebacterium aquilae DSM 44791]